MTPEQRAAYINGQVACALIEMEGMKAENQAAKFRGDPPGYGRNDFLLLIEKYAIAHNSTLGIFHE